MSRSGAAAGPVKVADIIAAMEQIAPPRLAEDWDNCGLQTGSLNWPVRSLWVALDPHPAVIDQAARQGVDMLITHHPLLFQPVRRIDTDTPIGAVLQTVLSSRIAVYAAHTNLDSAVGGMNDLLAERVGLKEMVPLIAVANLETDDQSVDMAAGMGRLGWLPKSMSLKLLAQRVKQNLALPVIKICGDPEAQIRCVALCAGSGSALLEDFLASDAQVFVSGDLRYHDARNVVDQGRSLIDVGHFASEQIMIDALAERLDQMLQSSGRSVTVSACRIEQDPFRYV